MPGRRARNPTTIRQFSALNCDRTSSSRSTLVQQAHAYEADNCRLVTNACSRRLYSIDTRNSHADRTGTNFDDNVDGQSADESESDLSYCRFRQLQKVFIFELRPQRNLNSVLTAKLGP